MIDNSSAFRMADNVPLVVPEVNPEAAKAAPGHHRQPKLHHDHHADGFSALHRVVPIKRIVAATYQAASGAGQAAMDELEAGTRAYLLVKTSPQKCCRTRMPLTSSRTIRR